MNFTFLSKFLRPQDKSVDSLSDSDYGSATEEETYDDCVSDVEPKSASPDTEKMTKERLPSPINNSVYPPLSSIATETIADGKEGRFVELDPTDDFVQTTPLTFSESQESSVWPKGSTIFKNDLQTLCQRKRLELPTYTNIREGPAHAPKFIATVEVHGTPYTSVGLYRTKGEAEQAAAKEALSYFRTGTLLDQADIKSTVTASGRSSIGSSHVMCRGDSNVRGKNVKPEGQIRTCAGLTLETALDPTEEEYSIGPSPPLSTASSLAYNSRAQSAASSYQQLWGESKESNPCKGASLQKKIPSEEGPAPAGLDNNDQGIAGQLSGLQLNGKLPVSIPVRDVARRALEQPAQSKHLQALGKLEFATHAFPILTRLNGLPLEEAYSVEEIQGLQSRPADAVDQYLLDVDKVHRRPPSCLPPPRNNPELLFYECHINENRELLFKSSENKQGSTVLQRTLGFDRVLQVFLQDCFQFERYKDVLKGGIFVGPRVYYYFVHKYDDDKSTEEEKSNTEGVVKCYFVCIDSRGEKDLKDLHDGRFRKFSTVAEVRSLFMHVRTCPTVAKYIARLHLTLSKTLTIDAISFSGLTIEGLEDLASRDKANSEALFTDGTGWMSTDLARLMPKSIFKGMQAEEDPNDLREDYPSLVQVRIFHEGTAYKGTLLALKDLPHNTIKCYNSMRKVQGDSANGRMPISSFELVSTSRRPRRGRLSRDLIVLLSIGGVDESIFLDALRHAIEEVFIVLRDRKRAYEELEFWDGEIELVETTRNMLRAGIPMEEPGLQQNLLNVIKNKLKDFAKGKVPLQGTFYLMGTADPTGTLKPNEVVIFVGNRLLLGPVLLYRAPGKHPGDPHEVQAVYSKAIQDIVGGEKNVIIFSTQGTRPLTHEIANGDLDGDHYWICENQKVVEQFNEWQPCWSPGNVNFRPGKGQKSPLAMSSAELEDALVDEYLDERFNKSSIVGVASMRWLTHADAYLHPKTSSRDKGIHMQEMLKCPDYIYEGVDVKSGKQIILFPEHQILKRYKAPYLWRSSQIVEGPGESILGKLYELGTAAMGRLGTSFSPEDFKINPAFIVPGSEKYIRMWEGYYKQYAGEMTQGLNKQAVNPDGPDRVNKSWKMALYGAPSFKERKKERQVVFEEASAIYQVVYRAAAQSILLGKPPRISFVWKVAGVALASIYAEAQPKESIVYSDSAFKEIHKRSKASVSVLRRT